MYRRFSRWLRWFSSYPPESEAKLNGAIVTQDRRRVVMISSTARDLPEHREQVRLACIRAGFEPRWMMEHLTAEDASAVDVSLRMVEDADVYLGILAYRYGTIPPGAEVSITEMEYDQAVKLD